jgi:hypothetical protein
VTDEFHRPVRLPGEIFENNFEGGSDPALISRAAHDSARALLLRVRASDDPDVLARIAEYTDEHGVDAVAELWARSPARSLPGALWRIYLLRRFITTDAESTSFYFQRGSEVLRTIDPLVAGATMPTGPEEITALADDILHGVFRGDFAVALERASAFCRVTSAGCTSVADDLDATEGERATTLTRRALRLEQFGLDLMSCARLWRTESLE